MFRFALASIALATATAAVVPVADPTSCTGNYTYAFEEGVASGIACCPSESITLDLWCGNDGPDGLYARLTVVAEPGTNATGCGGQSELYFDFEDNTFSDSFEVTTGSLPGVYTMALDFMVDNATACTSFDAFLTAIPTGSTTETPLCTTEALEDDASCTVDPPCDPEVEECPASFASPSFPMMAAVTMLAVAGRKLF